MYEAGAAKSIVPGRVHASLFDDGPVTICFDPWLDIIDPARPPFGFKFLTGRRRNVIAVKSIANNWYQEPALPDIIAQVNELAGARERLGYGTSMGAYAIHNFAGALNITRGLLFGPQFSVDPAKAKFDQRWRRDAEKLTFTHDTPAESPSLRGFLLYDGQNILDRMHAALILRHHALAPVAINYAGHKLTEFFAPDCALADIVMRFIDDRLTYADIVTHRRRLRAASTLYWERLAEQAVLHKKFTLALRAAAKTADRTGRLTLLGSHWRACALHLSGNEAEAAASWRKLLADPSRQVNAAWLLERFRKKFRITQIALTEA